MSTVAEPKRKVGKEIRVSSLIDFDGLREEVKRKFGNEYEIIKLWKDEKGKWQILIGIDKRGNN